MNHLDPAGAVALSRTVQVQRAAYDALGLCVFNLGATGPRPDVILEMLNRAYGVQLPAGWLNELGRRVVESSAPTISLPVSPQKTTGCHVLTEEPHASTGTVFDVGGRRWTTCGTERSGILSCPGDGLFRKTDHRGRLTPPSPDATIDAVAEVEMGGIAMTVVELREGALIWQIEQLAEQTAQPVEKVLATAVETYLDLLERDGIQRKRKRSGRCRTNCWRNIPTSALPSTTGTWFHHGTDAARLELG